jgi:hypothetical protein
LFLLGRTVEKAGKYWLWAANGAMVKALNLIDWFGQKGGRAWPDAAQQP